MCAKLPQRTRRSWLTAAAGFSLSRAAAAPLIETIIGNGSPGTAPNQVANPYGLVLGPDGALYVCEIDTHVVRRVDLQTRTVRVIAGSGIAGNDGDGGLATAAAIQEPYELRFDRDGDLYFVDMPSHVVRRIDARTGRISTVAGTGTPGFSGDGGPAVDAQLRMPHSIAFDREGRLLICDIGNHRVRRVDLQSGRIETWLGTGQKAPTPDGAALAGTPFHGPRAIDVAGNGVAYLALREGNAVYAIHPMENRVTHVAGTGEKGHTGDNGPAKEATLNGPKGIALSADASALLLADTENHAIRRIHLPTGIITTVAGTGQRGDGPDGDPQGCRLNRPHGIFVASDGRVFIGDSEAHRVRLLHA